MAVVSVLYIVKNLEKVIEVIVVEGRDRYADDIDIYIHVPEHKDIGHVQHVLHVV